MTTAGTVLDISVGPLEVAPQQRAGGKGLGLHGQPHRGGSVCFHELWSSLGKLPGWGANPGLTAAGDTGDPSPAPLHPTFWYRVASN